MTARDYYRRRRAEQFLNGMIVMATACLALLIVAICYFLGGWYGTNFTR